MVQLHTKDTDIFCQRVGPSVNTNLHSSKEKSRKVSTWFQYTSYEHANSASIIKTKENDGESF